MPARSFPADAIQRIPEIRSANLALIRAFEEHSAYASQSTARRGKVYFMHDFASRTDAIFVSILNNYPPPETPATRHTMPNVPPACMGQREREALMLDSVERCIMLWSMINDTSTMAGIMFGETPGKGLDLGDDVRRKNEAVKDVISNGTAS